MKRPTLKSGIAFVIAFATAWNANADTVILPALGEYILTSDNARWITQREKSTVCERFTANLNEFRHIPYHSCDLRLSPRHPEFSRPAWEEIPFDLAVAERFIRDRFSGYKESVRERAWRQWLANTRDQRAKGLAKLWRVRIDFDRDGYEETVYRVAPSTGGGDLSRGWKTPPYTCEFLQGSMHMEVNRNQSTERDFNHDMPSDMIFDGVDGRYYYLHWDPLGPVDAKHPRNPEEDIPAPPGATASLVLIEREGLGKGRRVSSIGFPPSHPNLPTSSRTPDRSEPY